MSAWFEDDTLWESLESFLFSQLRSSEMTVREAEQILTLLHPPQGAAVLDLCCGPGRHSLEFARGMAFRSRAWTARHAIWTLPELRRHARA
jgi:cyclopropane fatty-acyl-phospholipid synthase-like methyltransferase